MKMNPQESTGIKKVNSTSGLLWTWYSLNCAWHRKLQGNQNDAQQISSSTLGCSSVRVISSPSLGLDGAGIWSPVILEQQDW